MLLTELNDKTFHLVGYDFNDTYATVVLTKNDRTFYVNFEEDAEDGYRSFLKTPVLTRADPLHTPHHIVNREVRIVAHDPSDFTACENEFMIYDVETRQLLFEAFTDYSDTYYPYAVMRFHPLVERKRKN